VEFLHRVIIASNQCAYERPAIAESHAAPNDEIGSAIQVRLVWPKLRRTNPGLMYKLRMEPST